MSIFYKSFLPLRILSAQYLQEGKCFELKIGDPVLFILSTDKSFEMFPRHIGPTAISESFALK